MEHIVLTKNLADGPQTFDEYRAEGGYQALDKALAGSPAEVLDLVTEAGEEDLDLLFVFKACVI